MTKNYLQAFVFISIAFLSSLGLNAQNTDTLGVSPGTIPAFAPNSIVQLVQNPAGGYLFGTNWDPNANITGLAQGYVNDGTVNVAGVLSLVGDKGKGPSPQISQVNFRVHRMVDNGAVNVLIQPPPNPPIFDPVEGPQSTILATSVLFFDEIEEGIASYNYAPFTNPIEIQGNLAVSAEFGAMKTLNDTIGFLCDNVGDALGADFAYFLISNQWFTVNSLAATNNNIALFAVLTDETVNINEAASFNGMKLVSFPNPANDLLNIQFDLTEKGNYTLDLFSITGKLLLTKQLGNKNIGLQTEQVNVSEFPAGSYIVSLSNDANARYSKTIIIE